MYNVELPFKAGLTVIVYKLTNYKVVNKTQKQH